MSDILELTIGPPAHGGYCVARQDDGPVIFVRHTAPGERVRVAVTSRRSRLWYGEAIDVLQPHPQRVPHIWPIAGPGGIGGAELGHMSINAQRQWKKQVIEEALAHHAHYRHPIEVEQPKTDASGLGMRTRTRLVANADGTLGMYQFRSKTILPVDELPLVDPQIQELDELTQSWRPGTELLVLSTADGALAVPAGERRRVNYRVATDLGELRYQAQAHGFWQSHRFAPSVLIDAVLQAAQLQPGDHVWDLYAGAGLFTLPAAMVVGSQGSVHSVEADREGHRAAKRNLHRFPTARLYHGPVDQVISSLPQPRVIIADPPRSGMGAQTVQRLVNSGAERIIYVACDPVALARDLGTAQHLGWKVDQVRAFDLFPHTHHIEAVAMLSADSL